MFSETSYPSCSSSETLTQLDDGTWKCLTQAQWEAGQVPQSGCPPGQVRDFNPATGQYLPGCVDDTPAYRAGGGVTVTPKTQDAWTNYAIYGGLALLAALLLFKR